jgi:UPF0716 family protein affecting phage T7 exclusion
MSKQSQTSNNAGCGLVVLLLLAAWIIYAIVKWIGDHILVIVLVIGTALAMWLVGLTINKWLKRRALNRGSNIPSGVIGYLIALSIVAVCFIIYFVIKWIIGHILISAFVTGIALSFFIIGLGVKKWLDKKNYLNELREEKKRLQCQQQEREKKEIEDQKKLIIELIQDAVGRK